MTVSALVIVHVFHILFVGGLFLYLGIRKNAAPPWLYPAVVFLGIAIIIAHGLKLLKNRYSLVSWFHILIVAPLVIYIGRTGPHTPDIAYTLILIEGVLAISYHSYALYTGT